MFSKSVKWDNFPCGASGENNFPKTLLLAEITKQVHTLSNKLQNFFFNYCESVRHTFE